jgi:hypothetical protein
MRTQSQLPHGSVNVLIARELSQARGRTEGDDKTKPDDKPSPNEDASNQARNKEGKDDPSVEESRDDDTPPSDDEKPDNDKPKECGRCGEGNDDDAKFCKLCGEKIDDESDGASTEGDDDDQHEPNSKPENHPDDDHSQARGSTRPIRTASLAAMFGLPANASEPKIKATALAYVSLAHSVMAATNKSDPDSAAGVFKSMVDDLAKFPAMKAELSALRRRDEYRHRMTELRKLESARLPGYGRANLFVDRIVKTKSGEEQRVVVPHPVYAEMKLATLDAFVAEKLKAAPSPQRNPFEPDRKRAEAGKTGAFVQDAKESGRYRSLEFATSATEEQLVASDAALRSRGMLGMPN